jgi:hypothetical protein
MALSPELKRMVSGARDLHGDPLEAKRAEILASMADNDDEPEDYLPTIRDQLALLALQKATKAELRDIIFSAMVGDSAA